MVNTMKSIDLTHLISETMPVYPGTEPPCMDTGTTLEKDGFLEKKITFYSHTGTHIDAPAHLIRGGKTLDEFDIGHFCGSAMVLNFSGTNIKEITAGDLEPHREQISRAEFVLIRTGWSRFWGEDDYFQDYPVLSGDGARWLCSFGLKGLGLDTISADRADTVDFEIHKRFLSRDIIIIENLANLDRLAPNSSFLFSCFPLKFKGADGSPVRAVAFPEKRKGISGG